ncbi:MAG: hypothetical protein ACR2PG_19490 [Hyphomicrobiaceae bacterium]
MTGLKHIVLLSHPPKGDVKTPALQLGGQEPNGPGTGYRLHAGTVMPKSK